MRIRTLPLTALLFCLIACSGYAEDLPDSSSGHHRSPGTIVAGDGRAILGMTGFVFSSPARWDGGQWLLAGGLVAGTAGTMLADNDARTFIARNHSVTNDRISDVAVQYGSGLVMLLVSTGGYAAGLAFDDDWLRETALLSGTAIVLSGTVSTVLKVLTGRARPYRDEGHTVFRPFRFNGDYESFPSGHTIVAFAVSGVLAERIGNPWASIGLYGMAAATGFSRMYTDQHWVSDVVCGAILSISLSRSIVHWYEHPGNHGEESSLKIIPSANGLRLVWQF